MMLSRSPIVLVPLLALLALAAPAGAQCCGDCNGDGMVAINELITAVNNSLGTCSNGPTPTPTSQPGDQCPINFRDDNTMDGTPDCYYIGRWNESCGAADLEALWRSDGDIVIVELLGFNPGLFVGANVTGTNSATVIGWFTKADASDLTETTGTMALGTNGTTLAVDHPDSPFDVDQCAFAHYRGNLEDVVVPGSTARAASRLRALQPAALSRLRAAVIEKRRPGFERK